LRHGVRRGKTELGAEIKEVCETRQMERIEPAVLGSPRQGEFREKRKKVEGVVGKKMPNRLSRERKKNDPTSKKKEGKTGEKPGKRLKMSPPVERRRMWRQQERLERAEKGGKG